MALEVKVADRIRAQAGPGGPVEACAVGRTRVNSQTVRGEHGNGTDEGKGTNSVEQEQRS